MPLRNEIFQVHKLWSGNEFLQVSAHLSFLRASATNMLSTKRKRVENVESDVDMSDFSIASLDSEDEVDISFALTGKRSKATKKTKSFEHDEDDEEGLQEFIRESIAKRDVKEGTELLKKTKGKTKWKWRKIKKGV